MACLFLGGTFFAVQAISILASGKGRILDRLRSAYLDSLMRVQREDIPNDLLLSCCRMILRRADSLGLKTKPPPSEDEAMLIVTAIEDLSTLLDDQIERE